MSSWVFVIVFFSLISLSQQSGLDCDSISHSCASCINFGCSWCQGETNELSFCSKNIDHCRHGSLLEDSLFCPKSEPLFESIEWWGENAFFSRSLTCDDLQLSAIYCLTWGSSIPGYCIWCQDGCQALLDPFCYQGTYATHYDGSDPSDTVLEGQEITLNLNPYVLLYRESNTTAEESTSTYLSISAIFSPATTGCTLSLSGDDLTVTVVDEYIGQCTVRIEFLPRSNFAELGLPQSRTRVVLYYTVTSTQQNDPPEQSAKVGTIFSNFSLEEDDTNTGKINGCDLFVDKDKDTFTLSFATSDSVLSVTAASCICPTGCPLTFTTGSVEGDTDVVVTFTADDGNGGVGSFEQTIKVLNLKYTPTVTSPISTVELEEIPDETVSVDLAAHFEIEDDSTLSYNVEVAPTLVSYELNSETGLLTFTSAGELFGSENVTVSAASEDRKAVIQFLLRVTPVNDPPVVVKESESYRQNAGTQLIVPISTFVTDPDGDVLTCGPQSDDQARVQFANGNMTISFLKKTTEPSRFEITCTDAGGVQAQFNLEISVTLDNRAPQIIKNFTQIKFAPTNTDDFDLTFYFSDADIPLGDTLTYTAVSSNSTLLKFDIQGNTLTVTADANAAGLYSLSVTATDSANSTATQSLPVLIYRAVTCSDFQKSWTPTAPLIISFATECTYFLPFTVAFQERQDTGSLYNEITPELNGTDLILKHTSGCSGGGSYLGIVTLTDGYTLVNRTLRVSVTQTNTLVTAKTSYSYVVVDQLGTTTGYDGEFRLSSSSTVRIDLNAVVQSCAQVAQSLTFSNTTSIDGQFLDQAKKAVSGAIKGEFGKDTTGYYLLLKSNPTAGSGPVPLIRAWELSFGVKVVDGKGSSVTFSVRVTKPNNSGNMTGNATGVATGNS